MKTIFFMFLFMTTLAQAPRAFTNTWEAFTHVAEVCTPSYPEVLY